MTVNELICRWRWLWRVVIIRDTNWWLLNEHTGDFILFSGTWTCFQFDVWLEFSHNSPAWPLLERFGLESWGYWKLEFDWNKKEIGSYLWNDPLISNHKNIVHEWNYKRLVDDDDEEEEDGLFLLHFFSAIKAKDHNLDILPYSVVLSTDSNSAHLIMHGNYTE